MQNDFVYEWFEQRKLSLNEVINKYQNKIKKQDINIITFDNKNIGLFQVYRYEDSLDTYEYDLFIGDKNYLYKGYSSIIVNMINDYIHNKYNVNNIILSPFKRNKVAISCYLKCGFKIIDSYKGKDTLGNEEEIVVIKKE